MRTTKIDSVKKQGRLALAYDGFYYPIADLRKCFISNEIIHVNMANYYVSKEGSVYYKPQYNPNRYVELYTYNGIYHKKDDLDALGFVDIVSFNTSYSKAPKKDCVKECSEGTYILRGEARELYYASNDGEVVKGWFHRRVSYFQYDGRLYNSNYANQLGFVYCSDDGSYIPKENAYYDSYNSCYTRNPIYTFAYHQMSNVMSDNCSNNSRFKIGYEIEKEDENILQSATAPEIYERTKWIKERDGSLDSGGYELKSPIFALDKGYIFDSINSSEILTNHINAESSHRCGGHINISEVGLSSRELYNKIEFFNRLVEALYYPRVKENSYARIREEYNCDKDSICIKSYALEFRSFNRVRNVQQLEYRTDLIQYGLNNDFSSATNSKRLFENCDTLNGILENMYASSKGFQKNVIRDRYAEILERYYHLDYDNISI